MLRQGLSGQVFHLAWVVVVYAQSRDGQSDCIRGLCSMSGYVHVEYLRLHTLLRYVVQKGF